MGYHKDRMIQELDQGWSYTDTTICYRCLHDPYLRSLAKNTAKESECSYCERVSHKQPIAIPFDDLVAVIYEAVTQYYDLCENEAIAWDQEEGEYMGSTFDTYDLVHDKIPQPSEHQKVLMDIVHALGQNDWCKISPYSLTGAERILRSWETFCDTVKHDTRYFFDSTTGDEDSEKIPVPQMLGELREIITYAGLINTIDAGKKFHRIRPHKATEVCDSWSTLGAPPPKYAVSNRMSAAGISVFYAGLDLTTARAETMANVSPDDDRIFTVGVWSNTRPLNVLDLTRLPEAPSFYARERYDRDQLVFLQKFVRNITKPVSHDGREHIDYVPTQILTEYFRHRYELPDNSRLDGIIYPSAQNKRGRSIVIFASHKDLNPSPPLWGDERTPTLTLDVSTIRRVRRPRQK